ncbi:hypothetical protein NHQ30_000396 [Ciborinia camelliae]|nr:hypothetical protein NHQ30_000396 [Ciborinia camelliae]
MSNMTFFCDLILRQVLDSQLSEFTHYPGVNNIKIIQGPVRGGKFGTGVSYTTPSGGPRAGMISSSGNTPGLPAPPPTGNPPPPPAGKHLGLGSSSWAPGNASGTPPPPPQPPLLLLIQAQMYSRYDGKFTLVQLCQLLWHDLRIGTEGTSPDPTLVQVPAGVISGTKSDLLALRQKYSYQYTLVELGEKMWEDFGISLVE